MKAVWKEFNAYRVLKILWSFYRIMAWVLNWTLRCTNRLIFSLFFARRGNNADLNLLLANKIIQTTRETS